MSGDDIQARRTKDQQALERAVGWFRLRGWDDDMLNCLFGDVAQYGHDATRVAVSFTDEHVQLLSAEDVTVEVTGDVRDGAVRLEAHRPKLRALTGEGHGWVAVNGVRHKRP